MAHSIRSCESSNCAHWDPPWDKLNGNVRVLRLSSPASDASRCVAVVSSLVRCGDEWVRSDVRPVLVPLTSLGRRVVVSASETAADAFAVAEAAVRAGGPRLRPLTLGSEEFGAAVMWAVSKGLMAMTVAELQGGARGAWRGQERQQGMAAAPVACSDPTGTAEGGARTAEGTLWLGQQRRSR